MRSKGILYRAYVGVAVGKGRIVCLFKMLTSKYAAAQNVIEGVSRYWIRDCCQA